ncbi:MAG TPA: glycosyltransferase [Longimicrobium sp.]|nr:glycosyltransferase [Longimicrobium sp.]
MARYDIRLPLQGLDTFFRPGEEILIAGSTAEALEALARSPAELARLAEAARERTLAEHTSDRRAAELERLLDAALVGGAAHTVALEV